MTKADLINAVAEKSGLSKKDSEKAIGAMLEAITDALKAGERVALVGFGTFETKERKERQGINPVTKSPMTIPACTVPSFSAGKALKDAVK
ncbi:MAG: HU family DNA-binding protein [Anaerotruncus sp.]|nr:HU family DNA-binding protein [Anaerotruncus sp.]